MGSISNKEQETLPNSQELIDNTGKSQEAFDMAIKSISKKVTKQLNKASKNINTILAPYGLQMHIQYNIVPKPMPSTKQKEQEK